MKDPLLRRGLRECLESYAARLNMPIGKARGAWRAQGVIALSVTPRVFVDVCASHVRVAPGVPIPIPGFPPHEVIESDDRLRFVWRRLQVFNDLIENIEFQKLLLKGK